MLIFGGTLEVSGGWWVKSWLYAGGVCVWGGGGGLCKAPVVCWKCVG